MNLGLEITVGLETIIPFVAVGVLFVAAIIGIRNPRRKEIIFSEDPKINEEMTKEFNPKVRVKHLVVFRILFFIISFSVFTVPFDKNDILESSLPIFFLLLVIAFAIGTRMKFEYQKKDSNKYYEGVRKELIILSGLFLVSFLAFILLENT